MPEDHPDLIIATKLAKKLNLDFEIKQIHPISPPGLVHIIIITK
jgi:hypothetical protein